MNKQSAGIKRTSWKSRACLGAGTMLLAAQFGHAAAAPQQADIDALRKQLAEQKVQLEAELNKLEQHKHALQETRRSIEALQLELGMPVEIDPIKVSQADQSMYRGRGPDSAERMDNVLDAVNLFAEPSIMTPKGTFVFDPYLQYVYNSSDRLSVIGFSFSPRRPSSPSAA